VITLIAIGKMQQILKEGFVNQNLEDGMSIVDNTGITQLNATIQMVVDGERDGAMNLGAGNTMNPSVRTQVYIQT